MKTFTLKHQIFCTLFLCSFLNIPFIHAGVPAADGIVKGVVIDSIAGSKIEYATVAIIRYSDSSIVSGVITGRQGEFKLSGLPQGEYYLRIQFMGFKTFEIHHLKIDNSKTSIDVGIVKMLPGLVSLSETTVVAEKRMIEYKLDKKVINASAQSVSTGGTAVDLLRNSPSISIDAQDNVTLRGKTTFQVLINGRPSVLQASDALKQIPASSIDQIEIVTNPSASNEAEGSAGIINIITKKNTMQGLGSYVSLTAGTDRLNGDVNINLQKQKWNFVLGAKAMDYKVPVYMDIQRGFESVDTSTVLYDKTIQYHITKSRNIVFGIDYDMNAENLFSLSTNVGTWYHIHDFNSKYKLVNSIQNSSDYSLSNNYFKIGSQFLTANFNYKHLFNKKQHELSLNMYYSIIDGSRDMESNHQFSDVNWNEINSITKIDAVESSFSTDIRFNADYKLPISETALFEAGTQVQLKPYRADMDYLKYSINNPVWINDSLYTNEITFNTQLYAAYMTYSGMLKSLEYKLGIREEYYQRDFSFVNSDVNYNYKSLDFFPSIHVSYKLKEKNQFQLSYSRRINRPVAWFMYPVPDFSDDFMVGSGNPDLKPEFIDSYEFNYIRQFKKCMLSAELFHRRTYGSMSQYIVSDENGKLYQTTKNFGDDFSSGLEMSLNADITKSINANLSGSVYHYLLIIKQDNNRRVESMAGNVRLNSSFNFTKTAKLQVSLSYDSPVKYIQGNLVQSFNGILAFRKDFPKQKLAVTLSAQNPIMGRYIKYEVNGSNYYLHSKDRFDPVYSISVSFRFNKFKRNRSVIDSGVGEGVS